MFHWCKPLQLRACMWNVSLLHSELLHISCVCNATSKVQKVYLEPHTVSTKWLFKELAGIRTSNWNETQTSWDVEIAGFLNLSWVRAQFKAPPGNQSREKQTLSDPRWCVWLCKWMGANIHVCISIFTVLLSNLEIKRSGFFQVSSNRPGLCHCKTSTFDFHPLTAHMVVFPALSLR